MTDERVHDALARRLYAVVDHMSAPKERLVMHKFAELLGPILARHSVPDGHEVHLAAADVAKGLYHVGTTCALAISAGVTPLELQAIIDLAIRQGSDQPSRQAPSHPVGHTGSYPER